MFAPSEPVELDALRRLEALRGRCRRALEADALTPGSALDAGHAAAADPHAPAEPAPATEVDLAGAVPEDPVAVALAAVERAIVEDPGGWSDAAVEQRVLAASRLVDRAKVAQVLAVGVWDARQVWAGKGFRGPWGWLAREGDLTFGEARTLCGTAKIAFEHDVVAAHLRAGSLKCRQVEQLAQAATRDRSELFARDVEVLTREMAKLGPYDAAMVVRRWKELVDDELATDEAVDQHARRRLHHSQVGEGWKTDGYGDLESGAVIEQALASATDPPDDTTLPGSRSAAQRRYDGLVKLARHWLDHRNARCPSSPAVTVSLHVDEKTLVGSSADGFDPAARCELVPGGPIARSTARRLLCDSVIGRVVFDARGEPVDLGRTERLFSPAQRRAMIARDGPTCVVPYCTVPADDCQAHHLDWFEAGGPTDVANGAMLCNGTHHDVHDRGYKLKRLKVPGHYSWTAPDGRVWTTDRTNWGARLPRE